MQKKKIIFFYKNKDDLNLLIEKTNKTVGDFAKFPRQKTDIRYDR